jgi:type II secretory pathway component PulJ
MPESRMRPAERGAVLLEAIVALTLLLLAGVSVVTLLGASLRSEDQLRRRERELAALDRVLAGMTLLTRTDLDRRLGRHPLGPFVTEVQRPEPTLYRIAVSDARTPLQEGLVTVVYRPREEGR